MVSDVWLNIGCGTHLAPAPWINTDTRENDNTHPDVIVPAGSRFPFDDGSCSRVLLSHVLEHVAWPALPAFLAEVRRVLDGDLLVVGPDVYRTIHLWRENREPWSLVTSVLEHAAHVDVDNGWPEASHHWNCHEHRVVDVLHRAGFADVQAIDIATVDMAAWPIVNVAAWQLAVTAR